MARRALALQAEAADHETQIEVLVARLAPPLLAEPGVGAITAARILCAWSHPGRIRSEAAFASLASASPIPASSGQVVRYRLNRGGDRQLNRALHTIVLAHHGPTRAYAARRTAEGKTPREIKRCLKRYLARQLFRLLEGMPQRALDSHRSIRSIALGVQAARRSHRGTFASAQQWVARLAAAKRSGRLDEELEKIGRVPLIVVGEVGYIPFDPEAAALFFALVSSR